MNKCREGWPNAPSDVSPDAYDAFLAHVAGCLYHSKVLQADAEKIRSKYRLARGLDTHGRILVGRDLRRAIEKHDRQYTLWQEVGLEFPRPFRWIYLSNRGEDVAGSGKFFEFRKYEGEHRLDPHAGLQILGVVGEGRSTLEVLLGFYPLEGVKHTGEEQFLSLENGYTVGLRVEQLSQRDFYIEFRCVENEVLERERIRFMHHNTVNNAAGLSWKAVTHTAEWLRSSFRWTTAKLGKLGSSVVQSEQLSFQQKVACYSACGLVFVATLMVLPWLDESPHIKTGVINDVETHQHSRPANAKGNRARRRVGRSAPQQPDQITVRSDEVSKPSHVGLTPQTQGGGSEGIAAPNDKPPSPESKPDTNADPVDTAPAPWHFQSLPPAAVTVDSVAVHSGSDPTLAKKLTVEMRKRDISIRPYNARSLKRNHVAVAWSIIREETTVTVEATLTADGDSKVLTFRSDGRCPEQVCDEAVRTAVSGVFAVMRDLTHSELTNSEEF